MDAGSVVNQGLIGMQRSQTEMLRSAEQITRATTSGAGDVTMDITEAVVSMKVQQQVFDGSARVVEAGSETLGRLLDIKA